MLFSYFVVKYILNLFSFSCLNSMNDFHFVQHKLRMIGIN